MDLLLRFHNKIELGDNGCHEWIAVKNNEGYGQFSINGKMVLSHRFAYQLYKGQIPKHLQLDHLCHNRVCVNPNHLEAVTQQANIKRGLLGKIIHYNTKKTHCKRGHEFNKENTYIHKNTRYCITCKRLR